MSSAGFTRKLTAVNLPVNSSLPAPPFLRQGNTVYHNGSPEMPGTGQQYLHRLKSRAENAKLIAKVI